MDIQEAIQHCRDVANGCPAGDRDCANQHDHLADWLEELASYRDAMPLEQVQELDQAEREGRLVVLPPKVKRTPHDEKIDALKIAVWQYCSKFMQMQTYGECRAACPFHAIGNHGQAMCSDRAIEENPEKVAEILGIEWDNDAVVFGMTQ